MGSGTNDTEEASPGLCCSPTLCEQLMARWRIFLMNETRTPQQTFCLSVLWVSEIIFKVEVGGGAENQVTTETRFQSLLGCRMGTETEPGIEKEFGEVFEKRQL